MARKIMTGLREQGLVVYPRTGTKDGISGDHILLAPPLIITKNEINKIIQILQNFLSNL